VGRKAPALSGADELRAAVVAQRAELRQLLAELVAIESHASQPEGVARVADAVLRLLEGIGFVWEHRRGFAVAEDDRWLAQLMLPGFDYARVADVVVGTRPGAAPRVLLLADLDTAFEPGAGSRFPLRIEGERAYGPGVADMKGGLVVLVAALRALPRAASPTITIVLSPDEQAGSLLSRSVIEAAARDADWCLCLECARDGGNVMASRAHIGVARLDVYGREAHAGSAHASGANALERLARVVLALQGLTDPARGVYVTVTLAGGGRRRSVVPGHAWCVIDVRTPDARAWEVTERRIREVAASGATPGTRTELRIRAHRPGVPWTERTDMLLDLCRRAGAEAGVSFGAIRSPAAGSSAFAGATGVPTLDGMGPLGGDLMTEEEHIDLASLEERALLLALTLQRLAKENGGRLT
jgi:glutamate carboxypeptidase